MTILDRHGGSTQGVPAILIAGAEALRYEARKDERENPPLSPFRQRGRREREGSPPPRMLRLPKAGSSMTINMLQDDNFLSSSRIPLTMGINDYSGLPGWSGFKYTL